MTAYRLLVVVLLILIALLQARIWSADGGIAALRQLQAQVADLREKVRRQQTENERLREQIRAIRHDPQTLEALARRELGMLMPDEHFIRLIILSKPQKNDSVPQKPAKTP